MRGRQRQRRGPVMPLFRWPLVDRMSVPLPAPTLPSTHCLGFTSVFASSACRMVIFRLLLPGSHLFICRLSVVVLSSVFSQSPPFHLTWLSEAGLWDPPWCGSDGFQLVPRSVILCPRGLAGAPVSTEPSGFRAPTTPEALKLFLDTLSTMYP